MRTEAWIASERVPALRRAIAALSARAQRTGTGEIELTELERDGGHVRVLVSGAEPRAGAWEVVGCLEHDDEGPGRVIYVRSGVSAAVWEGAEPWCEHCGLLRRRRRTYLVRRGREPARQIGSSCLGAYTGAEMDAALRQGELLGEARARLRDGAPARPVPGREEHPELVELVAQVGTVVAERGRFVPRSKASAEEPASVDLALEAWRSGTEVSDEQLAAARELCSWGRAHLGARRRPSSYEAELLRLLERGGRLGRSEPAVVAGLYAVRERWVERAYAGAVGSRVEVEVEVRTVSESGRNRFGEVIRHGMVDERGRALCWFASGGRRLDRGGRYRVRARVRRHGEWRGRPVTVLEGCRAEPLARAAGSGAAKAA